ncbi:MULTISPECIES: type II toxin-antitoxin system VapC family toxin [unclassified Rhizobium]|jgi:ribonuclease VapC|uniref:type II toxin-antitoxin system VapC family toxin n=1 Tax=unclassified Rhizobium TaxID=2613769 RepID=UPI0006461D9E|nr:MULTISPECIES: type II toxin-antitoxin system VapC family toxin [unclassified Rhizobium]MBN8953438.1 type II toxin-antitoxin system VapC family toxin [Rhizobium tropici]OJY74447.1 MAG: VapC toxin family PIN domain ribonuclease [Rhizobium sp. 60-20]RKD67957.1 ribonuclease VapC [Rhizobium sp. WW_1]
MIAVDTSALMAIVLDEPQGEACMAAIEEADRLLISVGTVAEALIVASRRNVGEEVNLLISGLGFEIVSVTAAAARRVAHAYGRWGKGVHPAGLNYGDCFSYEVAKEHDCPLLYVGEDFTQTDVRRAR